MLRFCFSTLTQESDNDLIVVSGKILKNVTSPAYFIGLKLKSSTSKKGDINIGNKVSRFRMFTSLSVKMRIDLNLRPSFKV